MPAASAVYGLEAPSAFDGYGAQRSKPATARVWHQNAIPSEQSPITCEIDYGQPIAVSAFVHYFYVPGSRDLRFIAPGPSAFTKARIYARNDGEEWRQVTELNNLPSACPQVLAIPSTSPARYWKIEILELAPGAWMLMTYEIETYTGGVPVVQPMVIDEPNLPAEFAQRIRRHSPARKPMRFDVTLNGSTGAFSIIGRADGKAVNGKLVLMVDDKPCLLKPSGQNAWKAKQWNGDIDIHCTSTAMGALFEISYKAKPGNQIRYNLVSLRMSTPKVDLYYLPAYLWSREPVESSWAGSNLQTRMAGLGTQGAMLCLVPGTDRSYIGFTDGKAKSDLLIGSEPTPVLVTAVPGNWWDAYRFVVKDMRARKEVV
jgi:hypothetical protein